MMIAILKTGTLLICLSAVGVGAYFLLSSGQRPKNASLPAGLELGIQIEKPQPAEIPEPTPQL